MGEGSRVSNILIYSRYYVDLFQVNKFSSLKSNLSMRLRNNKNVSPRTTKKPKNTLENHPTHEEDSEGDEDTSGSINTSPTLEVKNDRGKAGTFKTSKEIIQNASSGTNIIPLRRSSYGGPTKLGSFQANSDIHIQFKHRSPELSPQLNRNDNFRASEKKLSEKTRNRLNQLNVTRYDEYAKNQGKDDGSDSGLVSPPRLDSDENMSGANSDSGAQSCRKASLDSLSGPSPSITRRYNIPRQQSSGSAVSSDSSSPNPNKENGNSLFARTNDNSETSTECLNDTSKQCVVKRSSRRANLTISPRVSKRELCTIMPGDDSFEEKVRALIDPEYSGQLKEAAHSEMNQPNVPETDAATKKTFAPISLSLNVNPSNNGPNAEWWLSSDRNVPRKAANRPKDKFSALSIISNAIDFKKRTDSDVKSNCSGTTDVSSFNRGEVLSPSMARRIGSPQKLPYKPELTGRVDNYNQHREECQRKVTNVLGPTANNDGTDHSVIETKSDQIQYYLEKVSRLIDDTEGLDKDAPQIQDILKNFQVKHNVPVPSTPARRGNTNECLPFVNTSTIPQISRQLNSRANERTAPLLDSTYSNLDYNKLSAR